MTFENLRTSKNIEPKMTVSWEKISKTLVHSDHSKIIRKQIFICAKQKGVASHTSKLSAIYIKDV